MFMNNCLDDWQIGFCDGSCSYGYRQHEDCIPESNRGRQHKMQVNENIFSRKFCQGEKGKVDLFSMESVG